MVERWSPKPNVEGSSPSVPAKCEAAIERLWLFCFDMWQSHDFYDKMMILYVAEAKFYNMEVEIDENLESNYKGLYVIGDGSGVTHSLSHASASGVYVARHIVEQMTVSK